MTILLQLIFSLMFLPRLKLTMAVVFLSYIYKIVTGCSLKYIHGYLQFMAFVFSQKLIDVCCEMAEDLLRSKFGKEIIFEVSLSSLDP